MIDFATVYQRHASDVFRFAMYLTGNRTIAEDVTAETFARAWAAADRIRFGSVRAYLIAIARNLCLDAIRDPARRAGDVLQSMPDIRADTAREAEDRMELARVIEDLRTLPEIDRSALLMRAEQDLSYQEIALALGITVAAAKVKVHRARKRLIELRDDRRRSKP